MPEIFLGTEVSRLPGKSKSRKVGNAEIGGFPLLLNFF